MSSLRLAACIIACAALQLTGCASTATSKWGEEATITPGWSRVRTAAVNAATNARVWVPLAGAALLQIDHWDQHISNWAREHTPVFGSQQSAERWSDDLRSASVFSYFTTAAVTPSGEGREWLWNKAKGVAVGVVAIETTTFSTDALKHAVNRTRPNGLAGESFPSGHSSSSAVTTGLASRNLEFIEMSSSVRQGLDVGLDALMAGTAWARVEAGWHFPSDTLVGIALGSFFANFFNDAFLQSGDSRAFSITQLDRGFMFRYNARF